MNRLWLPGVAAAALGAAGVLGFEPFGLFPLAILSLSGLLLLLSRAGRIRDATVIGLGWGLGHFLTGVSWVYVSLHQFGGMPLLLAAGATFLFCALVATIPAAAGGLWFALRSSRPLADALLFACAWSLLEWVRGWLFTGFPWLVLGYSQVPHSPLAGFAPLFGVFGVSWLAAWLAALVLVAAVARLGFRVRAAAATGIALTLLAGGVLQSVTWTTPKPHTLTVSLAQGNIPQGLKFRPDHLARSLLTYRDMVARNASDLVVLPESAIPLFLQDVPVGYLEDLEALARKRHGDVMTGLFTVSETDPAAYHNSAMSLGTAPRQLYRKAHLVPFGEFIPFRGLFGPLVESLLHIPLSDQARGAQEQSPMAVAGEKVAVNICYEDAFGEDIIRALPEATLLANLTNTAWFGDSLAQPQHLQMSQMRALESGRVMLRATNTGVTAVIGRDGRVEARLPPFTEAVLTAEVRGYTGATPYVRWGNGGFLIVAGSILAYLAWRSPRLRCRS